MSWGSAALATALLTVVVVAYSADAAHEPQLLLPRRPRGDRARGFAEQGQNLIAGPNRDMQSRVWASSTREQSEAPGSARAGSADGARLSSQPAAAKPAGAARGILARQRQDVRSARSRRRVFRGSAFTGVARHRSSAHSYSPAAHRRPAQPSPVTATAASRRRAASIRAQAVERLQQRRRQRPPPSTRQANRRRFRRPATPERGSGSPRPSSKQMSGRRKRDRTRSKSKRPAEAAAKPVRSGPRMKHPATPAVEAAVSLNGGAAAGMAKAHIVKAPLVQQPKPSSKVHCVGPCAVVALGPLPNAPHKMLLAASTRTRRHLLTRASLSQGRQSAAAQLPAVVISTVGGAANGTTVTAVGFALVTSTPAAAASVIPVADRNHMSGRPMAATKVRCTRMIVHRSRYSSRSLP